jgi:hypothetical protein
MCPRASRIEREGKLGPHRYYDENWMEGMVHGLYRSAVDEPVPKDMLDLVTRITESAAGSEAAKPNRSSGAKAVDAANRARRWRARAEDCRAAADSMSSGSARSSFLQVARDYEGLAELAEEEAHQRHDREWNAG